MAKGKAVICLMVLRICLLGANNVQSVSGRLSPEMRVPGEACSFNLSPEATSIRVYWTPPCTTNIRVKGYVIGYGVRIADVIKKTISKKAREYHIRHLEPNTQYVISIRAYSKFGDGPPLYKEVHTLEENSSNRMQGLTFLMMPPIGVRAVITGPHTATLIWMDPMLGRDQVRTDERVYMVRYRETGDMKFKTQQTPKDGAVVAGLMADTNYEFEVKTVKGAQESAWSLRVVNKTFGAVPGDFPHDLTVIPVPDDPSQVIVTWQPPRLPNGYIESYIIYYTADASSPLSHWSLLGSSGDRLTGRVLQLTPNTMYQFKAQVRNVWGFGPVSPAVAYKTTPALDIPVNIKTTSLTPNAILLTWQYPPHNVRTTSYHAQCLVQELGLIRIIETNKMYALFENLVTDEEYECVVNMVDGSTVGRRSAAVHGTARGF
ncbi:netrin receptor DCC-like [Lineus longissimus]|uniref:netrin receptor DCC-like n=1 Tax=Lineus longissimus TaxID=88925 RepID=UPI00315DC186